MSKLNDLWDFAVSAYAKETVEPLCLQLQDSFGLNVNLLLLCCWFAEAEDSIGESELRALVAESMCWQREVVAPLRRSRRALKRYSNESAQQLREEIKRTELEAERLELLRFQSTLAPRKSHGRGIAETVTRADRLLDRYLTFAELEKTSALQTALLNLRRSVVGGT